MAPIRCPVSCASTSATWNRQSTCRDTLRSARYSCWARTTRVGFFSVGVPQSLQRVRFEEQAALFVPRLAGPVEDRDEELQVVLDGSIRDGSSARTDPPRAPLPDEAVPVPLRQGRGVAVPPRTVARQSG